MSNVIITLVVAIDRGYSIIGLSIDGNTLILAQNIMFVTIGNDQSIIGMKTFTRTVISKGFQFSGYDNSSVFIAGYGVKSISDITANNLLNKKVNTRVSYRKGEDDTLLLAKAEKTQLIDANSKSDDDALLLLKANRTQLNDSYSKTETNNLLNNKIDTGVSYTKGEYDTLLLAKADKTQLIDSYTKTETNNLLNDKTNQSTSYIKTETDQFISQIDVCDVDLSIYCAKRKTNELLGEKADTTELSNYVTLGTSQTITTNKTSNNSCKFVSSIDIISTITGSSFVKSSADNTIVLFGAGGIKPILEFTTTIDDSNYVKKAQIYSRTETDNKYYFVANTYLTQSEVDLKLTNYENIVNNKSINGTKTFNANVNASGIIKTCKDDTSVILTGCGDALFSSFGGLELVKYLIQIMLFHQLKQQLQNVLYTDNQLIFMDIYIYMGANAGTSGVSVTVCTLESAGFQNNIVYADDIVLAGSSQIGHIARFRNGTTGIIMKNIYSLKDEAGGLAGKQTVYINIIYPACD
ncbi:MAG: hypothetical protein EZS28_017171 [Streblomastix strix]|uniref:Uncharacterized protein n=1 Tax=Streblomastix strix TaxID=222440 RepID=A0A5J4VX61_9EUKA|nr:MAG: hypothetical protein EZS28_017171 [Streblomastix strix]